MKKLSGFTLIEILVVVVILGILAAIVVPKIMERPEQARMTKVKVDLQNIEAALDLYKLDNGFYPSTDQGLAALVKQPDTDPIPNDWHGYLKQLPIDPWGIEYHYKNPGDHGDIDIYTLGPSAKPGVTESETMIGNWNVDQTKA